MLHALPWKFKIRFAPGHASTTAGQHGMLQLLGIKHVSRGKHTRNFGVHTVTLCAFWVAFWGANTTGRTPATHPPTPTTPQFFFKRLFYRTVAII